ARGRHAEIRTGGRLGAVDPVAPLDYVQIEFEDARLLQLRFQPPRNDELAQLAQRVLRWREIEVLRQLLRDRAAAAQQPAARPVELDRLLQLIDVDAFVPPESIVL